MISKSNVKLVTCNGVFVVIYLKTMYDKTIIRFCDIRNNQGRGKCHQPSSRPRLITITGTLIIPDITKIDSNDYFTMIHCFEINNDKYTVARNQLDIALRNHA